MAIDKEAVKYVAHLGRIELNPQEVDRLSAQLKGILDFIDKLKRVDIKDIKPSSHILPISNILRQDSRRQSLPIEKTLANAPRKEKDFFVVPRVIE